MKYRQFGKLDWKSSVLGFGAMRLPLIDEDPSHVNEEKAINMIRYAIDNGVNYIDMGYFYHKGQSERVVGKALKDDYREKVKVATKMPAVRVESAGDFDHFFDEQLKRLDTPKIDFYMLHGLNAAIWHKVREMGIIDWAEKKMAQGYFDYFGFSFHDEYTAFKEIIDSYDNWTFAQVLYNYMDVHRQAGIRGVKYASSKNLGVVVMEPIHGGILAKRPPALVAKVWETAPRQMSLAEWALQWVWNQPEISVALSGMTTMEQLHENITSAERSGVGKLSQAELALIDKIQRAYQDLFPIPCSGCRYCEPCPNGVAISSIFEIYNDAIVYNALNPERIHYGAPLLDGHRADRCLECNKCIEVCPQKIAIPEWLKKAHELLKPPTV